MKLALFVKFQFNFGNYGYMEKKNWEKWILRIGHFGKKGLGKMDWEKCPHPFKT